MRQFAEMLTEVVDKWRADGSKERAAASEAVED
jgi:hypothetical protein